MFFTQQYGDLGYDTYSLILSLAKRIVDCGLDLAIYLNQA